jgi:hypothetical protein
MDVLRVVSHLWGYKAKPSHQPTNRSSELGSWTMRQTRRDTEHTCRGPRGAIFVAAGRVVAAAAER